MPTYEHLVKDFANMNQMNESFSYYVGAPTSIAHVSEEDDYMSPKTGMRIHRVGGKKR